WSFSDVMNGLMALPNLIGLVVLSGLIVRETRSYLAFDPKLTASREEVHAALAEDPGFQAWRAQEDELDGMEPATRQQAFPPVRRTQQRPGPAISRGRGAASSQGPQALAILAPSPRDWTFAHAMSAWTRPPRPQSVEAITRSVPTASVNRRIRWATSSGCSTTFVAWLTTPGTSTRSSGTSTSFHTVHSCSWRTLPASKESEPTFASSTTGRMSLIGMSVTCGPCQEPQHRCRRTSSLGSPSIA